MELENRIRFRIRIGDIEVEAEGPEDFIKNMREYADQLFSTSISRTRTMGAVSMSGEIPVSHSESTAPSSPHYGQDLAKEESLAEFLERLPNKTHQDKILAFAYFLEKNRAVKSFGAKEINDCYAEVKEAKTNTGVYMAILTKTGLIMPAKEQTSGSPAQYTLTRKGEKTIREALLSSKTN